MFCSDPLLLLVSCSYPQANLNTFEKIVAADTLSSSFYAFPPSHTRIETRQALFAPTTSRTVIKMVSRKGQQDLLASTNWISSSRPPRPSNNGGSSASLLQGLQALAGVDPEAPRRSVLDIVEEALQLQADFQRESSRLAAGRGASPDQRQPAAKEEEDKGAKQ